MECDEGLSAVAYGVNISAAGNDVARSVLDYGVSYRLLVASCFPGEGAALEPEA